MMEVICEIIPGLTLNGVVASEFYHPVSNLVRCKDCKYSTEPRNAWDRTCRVFGVVGDDFFCAKGERKDGDGNG